MKSFFHSLKTEAIYRSSIGSNAGVNAMLAGYITRFYNNRRVHSSLGYRLRVQFEEVNCSLEGIHKGGLGLRRQTVTRLPPSPAAASLGRSHTKP